MWVRRAGWLLCVLAALEMYLFRSGAGTRALLAAVLCLPSVLALAALLPRRRVQLSLSLPETLARGEEALCKLTAKTPSPFPLPALRCRIELENRFTGEREARWAELPGGFGGGETRFTLSCAHSGALAVRAARAELMDCFGLCARALPCKAEGEVLILPELFPVEIAPGSPPDLPMDSRAYSSRRPGHDPSETFRIREYVPGDPVRQIHWKLSQKTDKVLVRDLGLPMEGFALLTLEESPAAPEEVDAALDLLFSLGTVLAEREVSCTVRRPSGSGDFEARTLYSGADWAAFQKELLSARLEPVRLRIEGIIIKSLEKK